MIPKIHLLQHMIEHVKTTRRNPAMHWTYAEEGLQHAHKLVGMKSHKGNISLRCLEANLSRIALALQGRGLEALRNAVVIDGCDN